MGYKKIDKEDILNLQGIVGKDSIFLEDEVLKEYSSDETEDLSFIPELVILMNLEFCNSKMFFAPQ